MSKKRVINLVIAVTMLGWMAIMALADSRAAVPPASECDPDASPDQVRYASPDARYAATDFIVIDVPANRCQIIARGIASEFFAWTDDGRYAVINNGDQYGNGWGVVFDTKKWLEIPIAYRVSETCGMSGGCNHAAVALAPILKRVVFEDGTLLFLSDNQQHTLLADGPDHLIGAAAFSPGEQYIAYVRYHLIAPNTVSDYAVYVANGDGSDPRPLLDLDPQAGDAITIEWYTDGTPKFTLMVGEVGTVINVWTGEINP